MSAKNLERLTKNALDISLHNGCYDLKGNCRFNIKKVAI